METNTGRPPGGRTGGETGAAVHHTPTRLWFCVAAIILGFTVGVVGFAMHSNVVLILGIVIFVVSSVVAWALGIMENVH